MSAFYICDTHPQLRVKLLRVNWNNSNQLFWNQKLSFKTEAKSTQSSGLDSEFVEPPLWNRLLAKLTWFGKLTSILTWHHKLVCFSYLPNVSWQSWLKLLCETSNKCFFTTGPLEKGHNKIIKTTSVIVSAIISVSRGTVCHYHTHTHTHTHTKLHKVKTIPTMLLQLVSINLLCQSRPGNRSHQMRNVIPVLLHVEAEAFSWRLILASGCLPKL